MGVFVAPLGRERGAQPQLSEQTRVLNDAVSLGVLVSKRASAHVRESERAPR
jgi:hypothetical protein